MEATVARGTTIRQQTSLLTQVTPAQPESPVEHRVASPGQRPRRELRLISVGMFLPVGQLVARVLLPELTVDALRFERADHGVTEAVVSHPAAAARLDAQLDQVAREGVLSSAGRPILGVKRQLRKELGLASRLQPTHPLPQAQRDEVGMDRGLSVAGVGLEALVFAQPGEVEDRDPLLLPAVLKLQAGHFVRTRPV